MTDADRSAFHTWFENTYGVPCPIDAATMGHLVPGYLEDDPSLHAYGGDATPWLVPRFTNVYCTVSLPPRLRTTLHPPSPEAFDGLVGRTPFVVIGRWSTSSLYWWQAHGNVRVFLRFPLGGAYSSQERDVDEMRRRLEVLSTLFHRVPAGTQVDICENMDEGVVRVTSRGRTWTGEFSWDTLEKRVRRVMRGEQSGRLRQDRRPAAVFQATWLAMEHLADLIRQRDPSAVVELRPPEAVAPSEDDDAALADATSGDEADEEDFDDDDLDEDLLIPESLVEACRALPGGAELRWSSSLKGGTKVSGWLALPSLDEVRDNETRTYNEGDAGYSIAPSANVEVCWPADSDDPTVYLFDNDCMLLEECSVADIFERMVDCLGMPGWATGLDEKEASVLSRFRKELGLDPIE